MSGAPLTEHTNFSLSEVNDWDQFPMWKESISVVFDIEPRDNRWRTGFHAQLDAVMLGPLMLALCDADAQIFRRDASTMARNGMDHFMLQFYEFGEQRVEINDREILHRTGSMLVYDLSREFAGVADRFANLSLIIPRNLLADRVHRPHDQHLRHFTTEEPLVSILHDFLQSSFRNARSLSAFDAADVGRSALDLAVACLNAGTHSAESPERARRVAGMMAARRVIEANLANPELTPEWVAGQIGMSRSSLYRMFENLGGIVVFIRDLRLRRAYRWLQDPTQAHRGIADLALEAGYSSDTAFGRAFKNKFGLTPNEVRNGLVATHAHDAAPDGKPDRRYESWLTTMTA